MLNRNELLLYLCTDRKLSFGRPVAGSVEAAIAGGVTMVQVREKNVSAREFYDIALCVQAVTKRCGVPLVVNDRIDIALAIGADGLHVGPSDLPLSVIRRLVGDKMFVGFSAGTEEEAISAQKDGADYLGVGAVFSTGSKADAGDAIGLDVLRRICGAVDIPVVAIGGISAENAADVMETGASGVAVISAILSQPNIKAAAEKLRSRLRTL